MASLKAAIREKCKDCSYDRCAPGTYLQQIEACTIKSCALWPVRPVSIATITLNRKQRQDDLAINALVDGLEDEEEVA